MLHSSWSIKFKNKSQKRTNKQSVFPEPSFEESPAPDPPDIQQFQIESFDQLNWLTLGQLILNVYEYLSATDDGIKLGYSFNSSDFLLSKPEMESIEEKKPVESNENEMDVDSEIKSPNNTDGDSQSELRKDESSNPGSIKCSPSNQDGGISAEYNSAEDSDAPVTNKDGEIVVKPKQSRRRGSDLKFLEQWCYWDRNRKYSQRQKNKQMERNEIDTTINGILRKILPKYFE